jgi:hypothetical protein
MRVLGFREAAVAKSFKKMKASYDLWTLAT